METQNMTGIVRAGSIHLDGGKTLPEGTAVLVTPMSAREAVARPNAALIEAIDSSPPVPAEWVEEMMNAINARMSPTTESAPFDDPLE